MKHFALLLALAAPASAQVAQPRPSDEIVSRGRPGDPARVALPNIERLFDGYVRDGRMPGIVGAFGSGDRATSFLASGRIADGPAAPFAGPDSLWRIYSMTKPITGMAAMLLIEEGRLGLDDPVAKYIPAFARMRVLTNPQANIDSRAAVRPITIRHLLTHTSGLSYSITAKGPLLKEYERLGLIPLAFSAAVEPRLQQVRPKTLAEFADRLATVPLVADPGTRWHYSVSLDVLGRVIEVASGMPFERYLHTRLFAPLGMTSTYFTVPQAQAARLATNYTILGRNRAPIDPGATSIFLDPPSFPYGGAGLVSSARDYDRFLAMLANGGEVGGVRVMKPETVRLAMSNLLPGGVTFEPGRGYGAGGYVTLADTPGGLSRGSYGWSGAAGTVAWIDPIRRVRATVMVNYFPNNAVPLAQDVGRALARDMAPRSKK